MPSSRAPLRERILEAAFCAFMENGYAGTSLLEIATRAKVSKREIYAVCEHKAALLRDAIADRAQRMRLPLELPTPKDRGALAATLIAFGTTLLGGGTLNSGSSLIDISQLTLGKHMATVNYSGDVNYGAVISDLLVFYRSPKPH